MTGKSLPGPSRSRSLGSQPHDIEHVLGTLGIDGRQSGDELVACCPLHDDRRPSFSINLSTGLWICHAGCGGGNLAKLVHRVKGTDVHQAKRWLRKVSLGDPVDGDWEEGEDAWDDDDWWYDEDWYFRSFCEPPAFALKDRGISDTAAADLSIRWDKQAALHRHVPGNKLDQTVETENIISGWILPIRHPDTHGLRGYQTKAIGVLDGDTGTTPKTPKSRTLFGIDYFTPATRSSSWSRHWMWRSYSPPGSLPSRVSVQASAVGSASSSPPGPVGSSWPWTTTMPGASLTTSSSRHLSSPARSCTGSATPTRRTPRTPVICPMTRSRKA